MKTVKARTSAGRSLRRALATTVGVASLAMAGSALGVGGPVILGGDDLQDHGSFDTATNQNLEGWLYIQKSLENISPKVGRTNDGTVAALGAADAPGATSSNCGGAIGHAAAKAGLGVTYHDTAAGISGFFTQLASGAINPRIIWIGGVGASNCMDAEEIAAVAANASGIDAFVNQGGGLMSHGNDAVYGTPMTPGWLNALIPGIEAVGGGSSGDLELTPAGLAAFPGLTNTDVNAGPWHNHFRGDFGGLNVLVQTNVASDIIPLGSAVVLGGGQVSLTLKPADLGITKTAPAVADRGDVFTYSMKVTNSGPNPATGVKVTDTLPAGMTFVSASASQGTCTGTATVTCALGDMASGVTATVDIKATATIAAQVTNTAKVESGVPDPNAANDTASASTNVVLAKMRLGVLGPKTARAGSVVTYRLTVTNTSDRTARAVSLRNPLPSGFVIAKLGKGAKFTKATNTWSLGNIAAGQSKTVSVTLRIDRAAKGSKCVSGRATANNADPASGRSCTRILVVAGVSNVPVTG